MSRNEFVKLADAYMAEIKADEEIAHALNKYGIVYERETSPLLLYAERELFDAIEGEDVDIPTLLGELIDFGSTAVDEKEIYSAGELWDFYKD